MAGILDGGVTDRLQIRNRMDSVRKTFDTFRTEGAAAAILNQVEAFGKNNRGWLKH